MGAPATAGASGRSGRQSGSAGGSGFRFRRPGYHLVMDILLWILAVVLVVAGIFALFRRQLLWGIVLIVVGLLVGPGGVSLFN